MHEDSDESQITALTTSATAIIHCHTARLGSRAGGGGGGADTVDPRDVAPLVRAIASHIRLSHLTVHGAHGAPGRGNTLVNLLRLITIWHGVDLANSSSSITTTRNTHVFGGNGGGCGDGGGDDGTAESLLHLLVRTYSDLRQFCVLLKAIFQVAAEDQNIAKYAR